LGNNSRMSKQENSRRHNQPSNKQRDSRLIKKHRVKSVLELGRYKIGDTSWWVTIRGKYEPFDPNDMPDDMKWLLAGYGIFPELDAETDNIEECHPKEMYLRGPFKKYWNKRTKLPKLHHMDFGGLMPLLTSTIIVEDFKITNITRSNLTGEYYYCNEFDEWMPQSFLLDSKSAAYKERSRIVNMIKTWANQIIE